MTRREVVVAVRRGPVALVEEVLDIELRLPVRSDLRIDPGIDADEARQVHGIVRRSERIREVDDADGCGPDRSELILVPPGELIERHELDAVARKDGRRGGAGNTSVGVGVAQPGLPIVGQITLQLGLEATDAVGSRQDEEAGPVRVGQRYVVPVELVARRREQQVRQCIPFDADLVVDEFLRREDDACHR